MGRSKTPETNGTFVRKLLSFNIKDDAQRSAYELIKSKGRKSSKYVAAAINSYEHGLNASTLTANELKMISDLVAARLVESGVFVKGDNTVAQIPTEAPRPKDIDIRPTVDIVPAEESEECSDRAKAALAESLRMFGLT